MMELLSRRAPADIGRVDPRQVGSAKAWRSSLTPALIVLAGLLLLTAAFGKRFSVLHLGPSWLHPTEVLIVIAFALGLLRQSPRDMVARLKRARAVIPLGVLWLFGAVASLRGIHDWGFSLVLHDIGLVEYSVLIPLLALVVTRRSDFLAMSRVLALGGLLGMVVQALTIWTPQSLDLAGRLALVAAASGMYFGIYACWVVARFANGDRVSPWNYLALLLGIVIAVISVVRSVWLAIIAAFLIPVLFAPHARRLLVASVVAGVLVAGVLLSFPLEGTQIGTANTVGPGGTPIAPTPSGSAGASSGGAGASSGGEGASSGGAGGDNALNEVTQSFDPNSIGGQNQNARWRLAIWSFALKQWTHSPLVGVGFGTPMDFRWGGNTYDTRNGDPNNPFDVIDPHNSFIDLLYRTGIFGFLALGALVVLDVRGLLRVTRRTQGKDRGIAVWLLSTLVLTAVIASLNVALEGPYLGIFFYTVLGLGLLAPQFLGSTSSVPTKLPRARPSGS